MAPEKHFWTSELIDTFKTGQDRLIREKNHRLLKDAWRYDRLTTDTLQVFDCAIVRTTGQSDYLAFPYDQGCQLYCRDIAGHEVIRYLDGSDVGTFYSGKPSLQGRASLLIAKSPRECMLLHRIFGKKADIIGLFGDQPILFCEEHDSMLNSLIKKYRYQSVYVFLDCSSESAYANARHWVNKIKKASGSLPVYLVNIARYTSGTCVGIYDCVVHNIDQKHYTGILREAELVKLKSQAGHTLKMGKEALRLTEELLEVLPPLLKDYLAFASPLSDVPVEFLITPFLALLGVLIGKRRFVRVGGITLYPVIWTVLFAGSSKLRKSTALSLAKKVFKRVEDAFREQYERELNKWTQEKERCEEEGVTCDKPEPVRRTLFCSDSFSEVTFWEGLRDNPGLVSMPGEFTSLWNELNRPRNGMKDFALSIFDAEDEIGRNTKNGLIELHNPVYNIASATTMDNFRRTLTSQELNSGLLQRILAVYMDERTREFRALTELPEPDQELYEKISRVLLSLMDLDTCQVSLSEGARALYTQWNHRINEKAEKLSEQLPDIIGFSSRLIAYGLKFAMIFQQLEDQKLVISEQNMRAATMLCDWLFIHIQYMLSNNYVFNRTYSDRLRVRELLEKQSNGRMSRTDLMRKSHFSKEQLNKALSSEIESGFIREIKTETAGRPSVEYVLNGSKQKG